MTLFPKENDAKIADAILRTIQKTRQFTYVFNKKALYIYITRTW